MSLKPLNPHVSAGDPTSPQPDWTQVAKATNKVRSRHVRNTCDLHVANEGEIAPLAEVSGPQAEGWVGI